tara:strand:+ start:729 stop:1310 length:582 start_codon:yes stop_codon:yes gene_type:complete
MASKVDKLIDRLEKMTNDINELKLKALPLLPIPRPVKKAIGTKLPEFDQFITDTYYEGVRGIADVVLPARSAQEIINNPNVLMDASGAISQITPRPVMGMVSSAPAKPRKVTKKMKQQRKIQSTAFKNANAAGRKLNGEFRSGYDQSRIARMAQKECTKERIRLGLCDDPKMKKKKGTKKGQVRKTARRAFEK